MPHTALRLSTWDSEVAHVSKTESDFPPMCPVRPLHRPQRPGSTRWAVSEWNSEEIVRRGYGGSWRHRWAVWKISRLGNKKKKKRITCLFYLLPQSRAVWISPTPRLTSKSCSNRTLEWSATTLWPCTWDMASRFRSVLKVTVMMYDVISCIFKPPIYN